MRKFVFALIIMSVFVLSGTASAQIVNTATGLAATIKDNNQNQNTNLFTPVNVFTPVNANSNIQGQQQGQIQGQGQGQFQGQNNDQVIAPNQQLTINAPKRVAVGTAPQDSGQSELNFIAPNERDVTVVMPAFGCGTIKKLDAKTDCIIEVIWQSDDIKFKNLYKEVLKGVRSDAVTKSTVPVRYQIWEAASTKSWTTGGNLSGNGISQTGTALIGGSAGIFPQIGRSKSSNLYTIIFVQVQEFKK